MKMRKLFSLFVMSLISCLTFGDVPDCTGALEFVGNPTPAKWSQQIQARSVMDLQVHQGKIYIGTGDYAKNKGPIPIWAYDPSAKSFSAEFTVGTEAVELLRTCSDGLLYVPATDPDEDSATCGSLFRRESSGSWTVFPYYSFAELPSSGNSCRLATHVYDAEIVGSSLFMCGYGVAKSDDAGATWARVDNHPYSVRMSSLIRCGSEIFCKPEGDVFFGSAADDAGTVECTAEGFGRCLMGRWNATRGVFETYTNSWANVAPGLKHANAALLLGTGSTVRNANVRFWHATPFGSRSLYVVGDTYMERNYTSPVSATGNVPSGTRPMIAVSGYATDDDNGGRTLKGDRIALPEGYWPIDFCVSGDTAYMLAFAYVESTQKVRHGVWKTTDGVTFTQILSFDYPQVMMSLEYLDGYFYFGVAHKDAMIALGALASGTAENAGGIYRVKYSQQLLATSSGAQANILALSDDTTWSDLSALADYDGVSIAAGKILTLNPASDVTLVLEKPISGAGGVAKDGAGNLEIRAENSFDGTFIVGGSGSVYAYTSWAFGSTAGNTKHYQYLYSGGKATTDSAGAKLYLCGITTDESFELIQSNQECPFYAQANTVNVVNGAIKINGGQTDIYALSASSLTLLGGVSGSGSLRPSTASGARFEIAEKPLTIDMWNAKLDKGTFVLSAPGNSCGYTYQPITLGCDWAFNGASPSWGTGGNHMKIDLNGYANRVSSLACAKAAAMNGWVTSTRGKAFLYYSNGANSQLSHLPFRGQAGLFHEGSGTTTFTNSTTVACDTTGELCVTNGTVVFASGYAGWPNVSVVTLAEKGNLTLTAAGQIGTKANLELSGSGILTLPANGVLNVRTLKLNGVTLNDGTYGASQLSGHLADNGATINVTEFYRDDYVSVVADTVWGDAELAKWSEAGVQIYSGATLTISNETAYTLAKPVAGAGNLVLCGSGQLNLNGANPDFDGALAILGDRNVYVNDGQAFGSTTGATTTQGAKLWFNGITTAEKLTFCAAVYAIANTVTTFDGDVAVSGDPIEIQLAQSAQFVFNKSFSGSRASLSPDSDARFVFNCPCTATLFNSSKTAGEIVFNAVGNSPLGYFCCGATFGVDYAFDNVDISFGVFYYSNPWLDLNGHDQRVTNISYYKNDRDISRCSYATDSTGTKSFLHVNSTATADSRVYFKGSAGLYWENTGTVTFKENASTSCGDLVVAAGRVIFDTASWQGGDTVTVKNGAVLELKDATKFTFRHLVVEDGGKIALESGTLYTLDVTLGETKYSGTTPIAFADHSAYLEGSATISCDTDFIIETSAENADTVETKAVTIPESAIRVIKRGEGTCYVKAGSNAARAFEIIVEKGVLGVATSSDISLIVNARLYALTVQDGGTFELGGMNSADVGSIFRSIPVTLAGAGATRADGSRLGALYRCKRAGGETSVNANQFFSQMIFTADATIRLDDSLDCGSKDGRKDMNGHTFTKTGNAQLYWGGQTTAGNFQIEQGTIVLYDNPTLEGTAENTFTLSGGTVLFNLCTAAMKPIPHTLKCTSASSINVHNNEGYWAGPWQIDDKLGIKTGSRASDNGCLFMTNAVVSSNTTVTLEATHPRVILSGANTHAFGSFSIAGTLELRDGAYGEIQPSETAVREIALAQDAASATRAWGYPAQLTVSNATLTSVASETKAAQYYGTFTLAWNANKGAELSIQPDSVVTGCLLCAKNGLAAVRQTGGEFISMDLSGWSIQNYIGSSATSYGAYLLEDGYFKACSMPAVATDAGCTTVIRQDGGTFETGGTAYESFYAKNGYFSLYQTGGVYTNASAASFGYGATANGGRYEITATGADVCHYHYWDVRVGGNNAFVYTNIFHVADGATVDLRAFLYQRPDAAAARRFYLGSDGGILKPHAGNPFANNNPDRVTVYGGGLVIDTVNASSDITLSAAFLKPTGKVVTGISLPTSAEYLAESGCYLGPAKIVIDGGSGAGATAVTEFDHDTRTLTGVTIASPGFGYVEGDAVTAYVEGPFKTNTYACAVTLGDPVLTGGFTKRGSGSKLTLTGANDYAGITRIEGGSLAFAAGAYPAASDVVITADAVNEARTTKIPALVVDGFPSGRTVTVLGAENIDVSDVASITLAKFNGTQPTQVQLVARDSDGNPYTFSDGKTLYIMNGRIRLGKRHGTQIIVR